MLLTDAVAVPVSDTDAVRELVALCVGVADDVGDSVVVALSVAVTVTVSVAVTDVVAVTDCVCVPLVESVTETLLDGVARGCGRSHSARYR